MFCLPYILFQTLVQALAAIDILHLSEIIMFYWYLLCFNFFFGIGLRDVAYFFAAVSNDDDLS
jgi:hypothetical protein